MKSPNLLKTTIIILVALVILFVAFLGYSQLSQNSTDQEPIKIGIISKGVSFEKVVEGFEVGLNEYAEAAGRPITIIRNEILGDTPADYNKTVADTIAEGATALFAVALEPMRASVLMTEENQIPVIYAFGGDPVETGFVNSLKSSENNLTGVTWLAWPLSGKRLEILHEIVPTMERITTITKTQSKSADISFRSITETAEKLDLKITQKVVKTIDDVDGYLRGVNSDNADAIYYVPDPFILRNADTIIAASLEKKLPTIFHESKFVHDGALASYGPKFFDAGKQASRLMSKIIFEGLTTSEIPSESALDFEFVINIDTANKLGIVVSPEILSRADEVIKN